MIGLTDQSGYSICLLYGQSFHSYSMTDTSRSSYSSIVADISTSSVETVGDITSLSFYFFRCLRPYAYLHAFIVPLRFSFMNISISSVSFFAPLSCIQISGYQMILACAVVGTPQLLLHILLTCTCAGLTSLASVLVRCAQVSFSGPQSDVSSCAHYFCSFP